MMLSNEDIQKAKGIPVADYLFSKGFEPAKEVGGQLVYFSPLHGENTPSFFVDPGKNVFNDFGAGEKGDVIRLVRLLDKCDFVHAVKLLTGLQPSSRSFFFSGQYPDNAAKSAGVEVLSDFMISSPALLKYVEYRGISEILAGKYLREVHYRNKGRVYYALGFKNDAGGYELRSQGFKGKTGNGITTITGKPGAVNLFEGFFDFLSACMYYGYYTPIHTTIVLNSTVNLNAVLPILKKGNVVRCFFDNDDTGRKSLSKLNEAGFDVVDMSKELYPSSNDFNEFLMNSRNNPVTFHACPVRVVFNVISR
ncbi:toprim domain-containing protein [Ravibacter arvi]|uniref:Toprim domain-containing protein n=1 Tax=Ravibacter arvi TaxID=2051041 RepID=A0ABP8MBV4_9BACT